MVQLKPQGSPITLSYEKHPITPHIHTIAPSHVVINAMPFKYNNPSKPLWQTEITDFLFLLLLKLTSKIQLCNKYFITYSIQCIDKNAKTDK